MFLLILPLFVSDFVLSYILAKQSKVSDTVSIVVKCILLLQAMIVFTVMTSSDPIFRQGGIKSSVFSRVNNNNVFPLVTSVPAITNNANTVVLISSRDIKSNTQQLPDAVSQPQFVREKTVREVGISKDSKELIDSVFGLNFPASDFPDLKYRPKQEVHARMERPQVPAPSSSPRSAAAEAAETAAAAVAPQHLTMVVAGHVDAGNEKPLHEIFNCMLCYSQFFSFF